VDLYAGPLEGGTVRKAAHRGLRLNEQLFRSIFDNAQIGISFFSVEGREAFCNRAFQDMLGYSEEEMSHLENWEKMVHPDNRASGAKRYADLQQGKRDRDEWEQHFIHSNGHDVFTRARFTVLRDPAGKPHLVASFTEDITERKHAEKALRAREQLFRSIFENAQIGITLGNGKTIDSVLRDTGTANSKGGKFTGSDISGLKVKGSYTC